MNYCCDELLVLGRTDLTGTQHAEANRIESDSVHSRAISGEIAERLRASLSNDPSQLPAFLRHRLGRLSEREQPSSLDSTVRDR